MDKRTKILVGLFGGVLAYILISSVVYPQWIEPLLNIDKRIDGEQRKHDQLTASEERVDRARHEYKALVSRVGGLDVGRVETDIRARLSKLIEKYDLQDTNVTPSRATADRKTGLMRMQITLTATGKLQAAVELLKEVAELPHLVRVANAAIYPASRSGRSNKAHMVNLRLPLEVLVLPQQRIVGRIEPEDIRQPESHVRHADRNYSVIWTRKPFREPIPLLVRTGRDIKERKGRRVSLVATVSGGEPPYSVQWTPSERVKKPASAKTSLDTSSAFSEVYTVTVWDASGETAKATINVNITDPRPPNPIVGKRGGDKPPPLPPGPKRWRDRQYRQIRMTLLRRLGDEQFAELMVHNKKERDKTKQTAYFTVGDDFDGGKLVYVHPRGGVVRRSDEYFLYPIGELLDRDVIAGEASAEEFPDLTAIAEELRQVAAKKTPTASVDKAKEQASVAKPESGAGATNPVVAAGVVKTTDGKTQGNAATKNVKAPASPATKQATPGQRKAGPGGSQPGGPKRAAGRERRPGLGRRPTLPGGRGGARLRERLKGRLPKVGGARRPTPPADAKGEKDGGNE